MARKTLREAAQQILAQQQTPLHFHEITRLALEQELIEPSGSTPEQSMGASLYMDIKRHNEKSLFRLIRPGVFALASFGDATSQAENPEQGHHKLHRLVVKNFRSFKHVELPLSALTIMIGANGVGKSNLLDLIDLLKAGAIEQLSDAIARRGGMGSLLWRGGADEFNIGLMLKNMSGLGHTHLNYSLTLARSLNDPLVTHEILSTTGTTYAQFTSGIGKLITNQHDSLQIDVIRDELGIAQIRDVTLHPTVNIVRQYIADWQIYRTLDFDTRPQSAMRQAQLARSGTRLLADGTNLGSVLYNLSSRREYRAIYDDIIQVLKHVYPDFEELSFPIEGGDGQLGLRWKDRSFRSDFSATFLSDGTLRFLCLLVILSAPNPPELLCIDEPEIGLHPELLGILAELMRLTAERTQLIVITHSPDFIRSFQPSDIAVVEKQAGATQINRLSDQELAVWLEDFTLDTLWSLGEIGGRP